MRQFAVIVLLLCCVYQMRPQKVSVLAPETTYYSPGAPKEIKQFDVTGNKSGEWKWFFNTGQIQKLENYKSGRLHGKWEQYDRDGRLIDRREFINDTMYSWMSYASMTYQCGEFKGMILQNGRVEHYDRHGKYLESIGMMKNGVHSGKWSGYFASGKLESIRHFDEGKMEGTEILFYESGEIRSVRYYTANQPHGPMWNYFENGKMMASGHFESGKAVGVWRYYYENGQVKESGTYQLGQRVGKWSYYNEKGELIPQR